MTKGTSFLILTLIFPNIEHKRGFSLPVETDVLLKEEELMGINKIPFSPDKDRASRLEFQFQEDQATTWWTNTLNGWYRLTALPEAPSNAPFVERDAVRRSRLASVVLLFVIILVLLPLPTALGNPTLLMTLLIVIGIDSFALFVLNRLGKTTIAAIIVTFTIEFGLISSTLTVTGGIGPSHLPMFDLLVQGVCVAFALLPIPLAFCVPVINTLFIVYTLNAGPITPELAHLFKVDANRLLSQAITLQIIVSIVMLLLVLNTTKAIKRADRAEEFALFEQREVERQQRELEQSQQIEDGIEQILATLNTVVSKNDLGARVPLAQENVLWRIGRAINNLLARLQGLKQDQVELARTRQIAQHLLIAIRERKPFLLEQWTGTSLDPIIIELNRMFQQHKQSFSPPPQQNTPFSPPQQNTSFPSNPTTAGTPLQPRNLRKDSSL